MVMRWLTALAALRAFDLTPAQLAGLERMMRGQRGADRATQTHIKASPYLARLISAAR